MSTDERNQENEPAPASQSTSAPEPYVFRPAEFRPAVFIPAELPHHSEAKSAEVHHVDAHTEPLSRPVDKPREASWSVSLARFGEELLAWVRQYRD